MIQNPPNHETAAKAKKELSSARSHLLLAAKGAKVILIDRSEIAEEFPTERPKIVFLKISVKRTLLLDDNYSFFISEIIFLLTELYERMG